MGIGIGISKTSRPNHALKKKEASEILNINIPGDVTKTSRWTLSSNYIVYIEHVTVSVHIQIFRKCLFNTN